MSGGNHHTTIHEVSPMGMSLAHNVWAADAVKKEVAIPVIASGSINLPDLAESILAEGKGDFIGLGRPLWADPQWPLKAKEGRPEDIRPCIRCNDGCLARGDHIANTVGCTVNVALCREEEFAITPADHPMRVAVVGGGPAGMEAARVCALKGHEVTLYEKRELGGALLEASIPEFKAPDLKPLVAYLKTQVAKTGVKVVTQEATLGRPDRRRLRRRHRGRGSDCSRPGGHPRYQRPEGGRARPRCCTAKGGWETGWSSSAGASSAPRSAWSWPRPASR